MIGLGRLSDRLLIAFTSLLWRPVACALVLVGGILLIAFGFRFVGSTLVTLVLAVTVVACWGVLGTRAQYQFIQSWRVVRSRYWRRWTFTMMALSRTATARKRKRAGLPAALRQVEAMRAPAGLVDLHGEVVDAMRAGLRRADGAAASDEEFYIWVGAIWKWRLRRASVEVKAVAGDADSRRFADELVRRMEDFRASVEAVAAEWREILVHATQRLEALTPPQHLAAWHADLIGRLRSMAELTAELSRLGEHDDALRRSLVDRMGETLDGLYRAYAAILYSSD